MKTVGILLGGGIIPLGHCAIEGKDGVAAVLDLHPSTLGAGMHKPAIPPPEIKAKN
jgi:hypothetical protein